MAADPIVAPRLSVGVIGVGRAGAPLAAALARAGHPVVAAHAVSARSRRRVAEQLPGTPLRSVAEVTAAADLVLLTVPDDVLGDLVAGLADTGAVTPGQFLVHASGRFGVGVLEPATQLGALPLALHPVMTFTGSKGDRERLVGCPFGVTSPPVLRAVAEALVVEMGGDPVWVPESARPLYHAALANGANHLVTLVAQTLELLGDAGVEQPAHLVRPLLTTALDNVLRMGDEALTGPVARGDAGTVAAHLEALSRAAPEARSAYVAMARLTADRALAAGRLDPAAAEALLDVLG
ncbi:MAG: DUF2520 domain-containing protein [Candidatus Nanopelagicales bacterium]|nr:DUF2520 domain-containing protein [Candidatus Nanopelagicales bacterium]